MTKKKRTDQEAYDRIRVLCDEMQDCMRQLRPIRDKKAGVYGQVGQAMWRIGDAVALFYANVSRPK